MILFRKLRLVHDLLRIQKIYLTSWNLTLHPNNYILFSKLYLWLSCSKFCATKNHHFSTKTCPFFCQTNPLSACVLKPKNQEYLCQKSFWEEKNHTFKLGRGITCNHPKRITCNHKTIRSLGPIRISYHHGHQITCTHAPCGGLGWGGDDNVPCTCTHVRCYRK